METAIAITLTEGQKEALDALEMIRIYAQSALDIMTFENDRNATPEAIDKVINTTFACIQADIRDVDSKYKR